MEKAFAKNRDF